MNLRRRILDHFARRRSAKSDVRLSIWNLTRQTELAHCVDVADSGATRRKGLLGRTMLAAGEGLWIVPCESVHTFGMQFPIDLVYVDRNKRVKKVRSDVYPRRISACFSAHSVLELASGSIRRTQTKPGDKLEFSLAVPPVDHESSADARESALPKREETRSAAMLRAPQKLQAIAEFLVVGICTVTFVLTVGCICSALLARDAAGTRDFMEYWASGHQLAHHANPYNGDAIRGLEQSAGLPHGVWPLIMLNPPSALMLVLPLGFLSPRIALLMWSVLLLGSLVASVRMVWIMHGRPKNLLYLLGYSFVPALWCVMGGQVSLFALLGLVLFLRLHRCRPFLAGVSLWLCLLKPQLFLPFGVVLLTWVVITRSYKLMAGVAVALGLSSGIAVVLDPRVCAHYGQMINAARIDWFAIPCLSILLRREVSPNATWLQYLPAVLGCVWALAYLRRHRADWDWMAHGSPLMLVSVVVAPYAWPMDQAILLPALLHAVYLTRSRSLVAILALASAVIEIGIFRGVSILHSPLYLWMAPASLAWYLCAVRTTATHPSREYGLPPFAGGCESA